MVVINVVSLAHSILGAINSRMDLFGSHSAISRDFFLKQNRITLVIHLYTIKINSFLSETGSHNSSFALHEMTISIEVAPAAAMDAYTYASCDMMECVVKFVAMSMMRFLSREYYLLCVIYWIVQYLANLPSELEELDWKFERAYQASVSHLNAARATRVYLISNTRD